MPTETLPPKLTSDELSELNNEFAELTPRQRITETHDRFLGRLVLPSTFGPTAPVMLKLVTDEIPDIPVVTIRHGYETNRTTELADWYEDEFGLNLHVYQAPRLAIPQEDTPEFIDFQRQIKVEPFQQMLDDFLPAAYFSGAMRWQMASRAELPFVQDKDSVLTINPVADMTSEQVSDFFVETGLPMNDDYFDPAKGAGQNNECQLNTTIYK